MWQLQPYPVVSRWVTGTRLITAQIVEEKYAGSVLGLKTTGELAASINLDLSNVGGRLAVMKMEAAMTSR